MSSILVVEPENRYMERISEALSGEGWRVRVVGSRDQALQAAASEAPDLVVLSAELPGVESLASSFSRTAGGPGVLALLPEHGGPGGAFAADDQLAKPFSDQDLRSVVRRALAASPHRAPAPAPASAGQEHKLTSQEIFADVLADLEEEPALAPSRPVAAPPTTAPPAAPRPAAAAPASPDEEIERRLEKTLSGVLGAEPKPRPAAPAAPTTPAAAPRKPVEAPASEVDALLSKTLSNLDLGSRPRPAAPARPAAPPAAAPPVRPPAPAAAAPVPSAPPAPAAAPPQEGTAVRKPRTTGVFDFAELEELARPGRKPTPAAQAPASPPSTPAPAPVRPSPPPAAPAAAAPAPPRVPPPAPAAPATPPPAAAQASPAAAAPIPPRVQPPQPPAQAAPPPPAPVRPPVTDAPVADVRAAVQMDPAATQRIPIMPREEGDVGERFGQYQLLERIAVGGMAEVWKARMRGVEGFQKMVAIKKILPHMTDNSEFIGMFIDEAKLAAQLNHPNIVHIYDLGKIGRDYYIAMEYVEGKDLRSLLNASRRKGMPLPMGLALLIGARLASALDYAHRKRDYEGKELGLVHRDVSPQNVLMTPEGEVKLCDFGIAKAVSKVGQTQIGSLKGKLQYMSPEQAWGRQVDPRSDIFSLGAVLFEMMTGERLFVGETEMSVLEAVRQVRVRSPREVVPSLPQEVADIVLRALAAEPADRFQSAGEMEHRLEAVLSSLVPAAPNHTDLASYVRRVLAPGGEEDDIAIPEFRYAPEPRPAASAAPPPFSQSAPLSQSTPAPLPSSISSPPPPAAVPAPAFKADVEIPAELPMAAAVEEPSAASLPPADSMAAIPAVAPIAPVGEVRMEEAPRKSRRLLWMLIGGLILLGVLTYFLFSRRAPSPGAPETAPATPQPAPASTPAAALPQPTPAATPATTPAAPATAAGTPAAATPPRAPNAVDISKIVDQQLARQEAELRRQYEAQQKRLEQEIARNKAAAQSAAGEETPPASPPPGD